MRVQASLALGVLLLAAPLSATQWNVLPKGSAPRAPQPEGAYTYYSSLATFQAAAPGAQTLEDFQESDDNVAAGNTTTCLFHQATYFNSDNICFVGGDITPGLTVQTYTPEFEDGSVLAIHGAGVYGNSSVALGTTAATDFIVLQFEEFTPYRFAPIVAAGLDLYVSSAPQTVHVTLYKDVGGGVVDVADETDVVVGTSGQFFGFVSPDPIVFVIFEAANSALESLDNIRWVRNLGDVRVQLPGLVSSGVLTLTLNVSNHGPLTNATGVTATGSLSSRLSYVSNDCGATYGSSFSWNVGTVATGETETCHITANVNGQPGSYVATFAAHGTTPDPDSVNDTAYFWDSTPGPGPSTPATGITLFRSFPDVTIPDQTGAPFSFRAHSDKLLVVQMCTSWCSPCRNWADLSSDLQAALASSIGANNFLLVDLLIDGADVGKASTQDDASLWKTDHTFPGPVLHANGSDVSALRQLYGELWTEYAEAGQFAFPHFFVLAPNCENQIEARGTVFIGDTGLGEEVVFDTQTIDQVAGLATQVWNEKRCAQPLLHRIDRCSVGDAPLDRRPNGNSIDAAENFTVPGGQSFDIATVHAVVEDAGALSFDVDVYPDAAGKPGAVPVCTYNAAASTQVGGSWVRRIELSPRCKLTAGNYWFGLEVRNPDTPRPWRGGVLPDGPEFAFRDTADQLSTGCTDWDAAGNCLGSEASATELCYDLEALPGLFLNGFETASGLDAWSGHQP